MVLPRARRVVALLGAAVLAVALLVPLVGMADAQVAPEDCPQPTGDRAEMMQRLGARIYVGGVEVPRLFNQVIQGQTIEVEVRVPAGCPEITLTLAGYYADGPAFDPEMWLREYATLRLGPTASRQTLRIVAPDCYFQVDLAYGEVIRDFRNGTRYGPRLIDYDNGGTQDCAEIPPPEPTPSPSPSVSVSPSASPSPSPSPSTPAEPSPSPSPSAEPSPSPSPSPSAEPSPSPSPSTPAEPSPSPSPSVEPSPSPSPSVSPSPEPSPSAEPSPSPSPSTPAEPSPSPSPSVEPSPSPSASVSPSASPSPSPSTPAEPSPSPSPSAPAVPSPSPSPSTGVLGENTTRPIPSPSPTRAVAAAPGSPSASPQARPTTAVLGVNTTRAAGGSLASTGFSVGIAATTGLLLAASGIILLFVGRRRVLRSRDRG